MAITLEVNLREVWLKVGKTETYARIQSPAFRWAWLAFVKDGPSAEVVAGPAAVTVSWGGGTAEGEARVWAWRRAPRIAPAAEAGEG